MTRTVRFTIARWTHCETESRAERGFSGSFCGVDYRHSTLVIFIRLGAAGGDDLDGRPFFLPISARAIGEVIEMRPFLTSASTSPTICHTVFFSVSSSTSVTVAPNLMVSPESLETSMTSARASLSSSSAMRPSLWDCCFLRGVVFGVLRQVAVRARLGDHAR